MAEFQFPKTFNPEDPGIDWTVVVDDQYRYVYYKGGHAALYRHGELWWNVTGSNVNYTVFAEVHKLRQERDRLWEALEEIDKLEPESVAHLENKLDFDLKHRVVGGIS